MLFGEVQEVGLARERPGLPTEGFGLYSGNGSVSSNLGSLLYPTPPSPLQARGPTNDVCQCSSSVGFIITTCLFCSARSFPRASKLERSLEICLGQSPIPRHLLLPSSESIPLPSCLLRYLLSRPQRAQPSAPLLPSRHSCPDAPSAALNVPVLADEQRSLNLPNYVSPILSPTRVFHYQGAKKPI